MSSLLCIESLGERGKGETLGVNERNVRAIRIPSPMTLRTIGGLRKSKLVFRIECLANEFVFARQRADTNGHTDTSGGHFVKSLIGQTGSTEIVVSTENKVDGGQVDATDIRRNNLLGITGHAGETETDGQLGQHSLPLGRIGRDHHENFTFFFKHTVAYFVENVYLYRVINWGVLSLVRTPVRRCRAWWPHTDASANIFLIVRQLQYTFIIIPWFFHNTYGYNIPKKRNTFGGTTVSNAKLLSFRKLMAHQPDCIIETQKTFRSFLIQGH